MAKIDDSVKKKVPELIQKIILMILMGAKNAKTYEDLFCISQTKDPKEMVYDYDHEIK